MESFCDPTTNFIANKSYKQIVLDSSITEDEARKRCAEHTFKNRDHEGKDFFFQQHHNGHTICGFFDDKVENSDEKIKHGHAFGGICTIPEDVEVKLHIDEKVKFVSNDVKNNTQQINLVKTRNKNNTSELESIKTRLANLENMSKKLLTAEKNMFKSIEGLKTTDETMLKSIEGLNTTDETMFKSIEGLERKDDNFKNILTKNFNQTCNMRKGWTGVGGKIVNFKKDGGDGIEGGMTIGDCVRIGKQNSWEYVGHRNEQHKNKTKRNTCWRYSGDVRQNNRLETWVNADPGIPDMVNTTVELKNNCYFKI